MASFFRSVVGLVLCLGYMTLALADKPDDKHRVKIEFRRAETTPGEGLTEATVPGTRNKVYLHKSADATNEDIAKARPIEDTRKNPAIEITFTKEGAKKMAKLSEEHKGKPLAILIDGKVIIAPQVTAKLSDKVWITGNFTKEEVEKLVKSINGK